MPPVQTADIIVVGGTPAGIFSAIAASQQGLSVYILERTSHVGGLPANGLGATDIETRDLAGGLFREFTRRIRDFYFRAYGCDSPQFRLCSNGFHFEPSVAEKVLLGMLAECPSVAVFTHRQFDADSRNVERKDGRILSVQVRNLATDVTETYCGSAFIDATYEGDLAMAGGVPFSTRRESSSEYLEPLAGRVYKPWGLPECGEGSSGEGDDTIQAYNFRLCLTDNPLNRVRVEKPEGYDRADYMSLIDDLINDNYPGIYRDELEWDGIGRAINIAWLPNGKTDANNQHLAFISTDLPEENYPWPTADWAWRDKFQVRLRNYTLGLIWFMQNDPEVPESFRKNTQRFGLAADEYTDNGNFPRQVYVREGRRILGENCFLAHDALPVKPGGRPPVHANSIGASHYPVDSHAIRKREPGRVHLDGFISMTTEPYTVPYGIMVPKTLDNLWVPVAVSASHLGFGTLRMEPCWMTLGEAAGIAAAHGITLDVPARLVPIDVLQRGLVARGGILVYYRDVPVDDPIFPIVQSLAVRGLIPEWNVKPGEPMSQSEWNRWRQGLGLPPEALSNVMSRREALTKISRALNENRDKIEAVLLSTQVPVLAFSRV